MLRLIDNILQKLGFHIYKIPTEEERERFAHAISESVSIDKNGFIIHSLCQAHYKCDCHDKLNILEAQDKFTTWVIMAMKFIDNNKSLKEEIIKDPLKIDKAVDIVHRVYSYEDKESIKNFYLGYLGLSLL